MGGRRGTGLPRSRGAPARLTRTLVLALAVAGGDSCSQDCCTIDSFPIGLSWAPLGVGAGGRPGGLLAQARWNPSTAGEPSFKMAVDTGSPLTVSNGSADGTPETVSRSFDILGPDILGPIGATMMPIRARFERIDMLPVTLGSIGDQATTPQALLGGDVLRGFSVEFHFGTPSMTFWPYQRADDGFLEDVGYAVLHFTPFGGGELTANGPRDLFGLRGPIDVPATRIVFRGCVTPAPFNPDLASRELCCKRGDEVTNARDGVPLSLMLSTGVGPLVLSRSAWNRVRAHLQIPPPPGVAGQLFIATSATALAVEWTILPAEARLALVNQEASNAADPGPCVELFRSRRIEWVAYQQYNFPEKDLCVQPCDTDLSATQKAQNSAAYVEVGAAVGEEIPVAILSDSEPFLEGLRTDIRPEGPELDGIIGAGVLSHTRLELDYRNSSTRAIFSCEGTADRNLCWTGARCPRLPDQSARHACFGLPQAGLPATCADNMCGS